MELEGRLISIEQKGLEPLQADAVASAGRRWLLTRDFGFVWWSQMLSQIADGVSKLALLWFVYSITGSALKTTVIGLLQTLPPIIFSPLIGVSVDRLNKKAILIGSDVARAILIGVIPCMVSAETFTVEYLYILVFLYGIATAMFVPTLSASVPFMVSRPQYTAANALLQSTTSIGIAVGPVLSGLGIAASGSQEVLCVNALTYLASAACLIPIHLPRAESPQRDGGALSTTIRDLGEVLRYAFVSQRTIVFLILTASLYTFATGAFTTLFPVFGKRLLNLGPVEVGYLWSWLGIGLFVVSLGLVWLTEWNLSKRVLIIAVSSAVAGASVCALVWTHNFVLATVLVWVIGVGIGTLTPIAWGILQEVSPAGMVGRVMAIYTAVATATSMAGMTFFGWISQELNERTGVIGIGLVLFALAIFAAWFSRRVGQPGYAGG
ncbi:MAG TPA: MFS transporter [Nitrospiraceae bacterium]|nr:MFS transporter [Nitrospiraceae bacterium]